MATANRKDDSSSSSNSTTSPPKIEIEEVEGRTRWDSHFQFIISMLSFCIGLGNLWRFPYLIQKWGGGSFVLAFIVMMLVEGLPLLLVEFMLGQRFQKGAAQIWLKFHPTLGGIGLASAMEAFLIGTYYIAIVNWGFYYFFNTLTSGGLPWEACPINGTTHMPVQECVDSTPTVYFFYREAMNISPSISESSGLQWQMLVVFLLTWSIVFIVVSKGIETSGKAMYVTATFPYLVLTIFLVRGLTLDGAADGLAYITTLNADKLLNLSMWLDAACQVFYSLSIGVGGNIAFASYCPKSQNCMRDAVLIGFCNIATAIYVAVVIFSILGFKATVDFRNCLQVNIDYGSDKYDLPYEMYTYDNYDAFNTTYPEIESETGQFCNFQDIIENGVQGTGLAFIVITEAINHMPVPSLMSFLFFTMLLMLGLGSLFGSMEGFITPMFDFAKDIGATVPKPLLTFATCAVSCGVGFIFCLDTGYYWVDIFNEYSVNIPLLAIGMIQVLICCWAFGFNNWMNLLVDMIGHPSTFNAFDRFLFGFFHIMLRYISPIVLMIVFSGLLYTTFADSYVYDSWDASVAHLVSNTEYPPGAIAVIVLLPVVPLAIIPVFGFLSRFIRDKLAVISGGAPLLSGNFLWHNVVESIKCGSLKLNKSSD